MLVLKPWMVAEGLAVGDALGAKISVAVGVADGVRLGLAEGVAGTEVAEGVIVDSAVGSGLGDVNVAVAVGEAEAVGVAVAWGSGEEETALAVRTVVGDVIVLSVAVLASVGFGVGSLVDEVGASSPAVGSGVAFGGDVEGC